MRIWVIVGAALVLLALLAIIKIQHGTISKLRTENGALTASLNTAVSANESQSKSIDELQKANNAWASLGMNPTEVAAKLLELNEARGRIQTLADALRRSNRDDTPACIQWRQTDLGVACPNDARRLRDLAAGSGARPNR